MYWILCGIIAGGLYLFTTLKKEDEITALDLLISVLIIFLGWFALLIAIGMLIINSEDISWTDKLKNFIIYDKD